jgi:hypothetical protein
MLLGVSVIGWFLLGLVYVPLGIALAAWTRRRWTHDKRAVVAVAAVAMVPLLAMVGEAAYVDWRFRQLCEEAKLTITRKVVVEGFYDDGYSTNGWGDTNYVLGAYDFVEWRDKEGRNWRTERGEGEKSRTVRIDKPSARYYWRNQEFKTPAGHLLWRKEETVFDSTTGEVIGKSVVGYRRPPFIEALWLRYFDSPPAMCETPGTLRTEVLIGSRSERRN